MAHGGSADLTEIHVGDEVAYGGRIFRVRGLSPMSASPRRVLLEELETREILEVRVDEVEPSPAAEKEST